MEKRCEFGDEGKGRCNHIAHTESYESLEEFIKRIDERKEAGTETRVSMKCDGAGKGRCKHIQEPGESPEEFVKRI